MKTVVLAFDIERAGPTDYQNTIAIGASVVDEDLTELDRMLECGYFEGATKFDQNCWDNFWCKNEKSLKKLKYTGKLDQYQREAEMVCAFLEFRLKWENLTEEKGWKLELVSDNGVYDGGFINQMMFEHTDYLPIPYNVKDSSWNSLWETHSQQRGLLMAVNPEFRKDKGFSDRINALYSIKKSTIKADHTPANDAYNTARDQQVLLGIRNGKFKLNLDKLRELKKSDEENNEMVVTNNDDLGLVETGEVVDIEEMYT